MEVDMRVCARVGGIITISCSILVRPGDLVSAIKDAKTSDNESKVQRLLLGAIRQLKHSRLKPDPVLNAALVQLAEEDGEMFNTPSIVDVSCQANGWTRWAGGRVDQMGRGQGGPDGQGAGWTRWTGGRVDQMGRGQGGTFPS